MSLTAALGANTHVAATGHSITVSDAPVAQGRIVVLDGLRGVLTLMVVVSHFFAEIPHGIPGLAVGWMGVATFFVLSGFVVGGQILDRKHHTNFLGVFLIRRACRILPTYFLLVAAVHLLMMALGRPAYMEITGHIPLWTYLTFTQNFVMARDNVLGPYWLTPTWSLTIEEQFYLLAPVALLTLPRRALVPALWTAVIGAVIFRAIVTWHYQAPGLATNIYLPAALDTLCLGILAAIAARSVDLQRWQLALRLTPLVMLALVFLIKWSDGAAGHNFDVFARLLIALAGASYILALVSGAPETQTLYARGLRFMGRISYAVYLTHVAVIGLMHGLILGHAPDIGTPAQLAVTVAALPVALAVGWAITKWIEEPITAYGRSFAWRDEDKAASTRPSVTAQA
jgi:peptidoglycan/LPS O-acetylase OafA/YrhL